LLTDRQRRPSEPDLQKRPDNRQRNKETTMKGKIMAGKEDEPEGNSLLVSP
jgi:hypothetical protein